MLAHPVELLAEVFLREWLSVGNGFWVRDGICVHLPSRHCQPQFLKKRKWSSLTREAPWITAPWLTSFFMVYFSSSTMPPPDVYSAVWVESSCLIESSAPGLQSGEIV